MSQSPSLPSEPIPAAPDGPRAALVHQLSTRADGKPRDLRTPPGTVILMRHAEVFNPDKIYYGRNAGYHISDHGVEQANAIGDHINAQVNNAMLPTIRAVYSSPMLRARQTAKHIAARLVPPLPVHISSDLIEIRSGWDGTPQSELSKINFDFYTHPRNSDDEQLPEIAARMLLFIHRALLRHQNGVTIALSHGDPVAITLAFFQNAEIIVGNIRAPHPYPSYVSLTRLDFPSGFSLDPAAVRVSYSEPVTQPKPTQEKLPSK